MSKLIPPLVSTTPPPICIDEEEDVDDQDDDDFGDFPAVEDTTYGCDSYSIPNTPEDTPKKQPLSMPMPIHIANDEKAKDYQDKRKGDVFEDTSHAVPLSLSNGDLRNVPIEISSAISNCELTNGHHRDDVDKEDDFHDVGETLDEDELEKPPQLFEDDDETEKEEISATPSNFSISFDDNVIDDEDEDGLDDDAKEIIEIELPNHVEEVFLDTIAVEDVQEDAADTVSVSDLNRAPAVTIADEEDFSDFNTFQQVASVSILRETKIDSVEEDSDTIVPPAVSDDDFDDFKFNDAVSEEVTNVVSATNDVEDDDFDDFADFSSAPQVPIETVPTTQPEVKPANDNAPHSIEALEIEDDDDEFGDFGDYSVAAPVPTATANVPLISAEQVYEQAQGILKQMFVPLELNSCAAPASNEEEKGELPPGDISTDSAQSSPIFEQLKDVTDTHALSYQWGKSQVQQDLLKALNIDTRNILYAHGMPMPKFAANLGATPLEPIKSDILLPTPVTPVAPSSSSAGDEPSPVANGGTASVTESAIGGDIPLARFDWQAAGLANPLDSTNQTSTLVDLNQLTASLCLPADVISALGTQASSASDAEKSNLALDDWDVWLQSVTKEELKQQPTTTPSVRAPTFDTESVNSLQFPELSNEAEEAPQKADADDFSDFSSFQTPATRQPPQTVSSLDPIGGWPTGNMIPLRETYIDDEKRDWGEELDKPKIGKSEDIRDEPGWLKPTILTPVLPHKKVVSPANEDEDDFAEFQDFQTNSQLMNPAPVEIPKETVLQPTLLEPIRLNQPLVAQQIQWPEPGITDEELERFDLYAKKDGKYSTNGASLPAPAPTTTTVISTASSKPPETKLSGTGGALMVEKSVVVPANKVILPFNEILLPPNNQVVISKDLVLPILESSPRKYTPLKPPSTIQPPLSTEEDWSDFISTQPANTSNTHRMLPTRTNCSERSTTHNTTSELSLSIPQLSSIQPTKPPIPVITPHGLMQTKIPSANIAVGGGGSATASPLHGTPTKSLPQHQPLHAQPPTDGYQPAIISTQFAAQMMMNHHSDHAFSDILMHAGSYQATSLPAHQNGTAGGSRGDDADEWSDFMSSRPVASSSLSSSTLQSGVTLVPSVASSMDWNRNNGDLPNIITNPVHFQRYPTANVMQKRPNGVLHANKNHKPQNLNVAHLPELEFVSPKTKVYHTNHSAKK